MHKDRGLLDGFLMQDCCALCCIDPQALVSEASHLINIHNIYIYTYIHTQYMYKQPIEKSKSLLSLVRFCFSMLGVNNIGIWHYDYQWFWLSKLSFLFVVFLFSFGIVKASCSVLLWFTLCLTQKTSYSSSKFHSFPMIPMLPMLPMLRWSRRNTASAASAWASTASGWKTSRSGHHWPRPRGRWRGTWWDTWRRKTPAWDSHG